MFTIKRLRKKLGKMLNLVARRGATAIDILPDDVLLEIFNFCGVDHHQHHRTLQSFIYPELKWHRLIHVCVRWRQIIFLSPHRLDLYILCTMGSPVQKKLWPAFPIILHYPHHYPHLATISSKDEANIIVALEHPDRVRSLQLSVTSSLLGKMATVTQTQKPFPLLTELWLSSEGGSLSVVPSAFLGGSAPRLRRIHLEGIPFPSFPTFFSTASDLWDLYLDSIPRTGYFSPEAMATSLAVSTRLRFLFIGFHSSTSHPNQSDNSGGRVVLPTRAVLPALSFFGFRGASEYLEALIARIDAPRIVSIRIKYFNQLVFKVPQLFRFISQTQIVKQSRTICARVNFFTSRVDMTLSSGPAGNQPIFLHLEIPCQGLDWQVSHMAEALGQSSAVLSNVRHLFIHSWYLKPSWRDGMHDIEWLSLFRQFTGAETLRVSDQQSEDVAHALNDVTFEMVPKILTALRLLFLGGEPAGRVGKFITARQLAGLPPVVVAYTLDEYVNRRSSLI